LRPHAVFKRVSDQWKLEMHDTIGRMLLTP